MWGRAEVPSMLVSEFKRRSVGKPATSAAVHCPKSPKKVSLSCTVILSLPTKEEPQLALSGSQKEAQSDHQTIQSQDHGSDSIARFCDAKGNH